MSKGRLTTAEGALVLGLATKRERKIRGRELALARKQVRALKYRETDLSALGVRGER